MPRSRHDPVPARLLACACLTAMFLPAAPGVGAEPDQDSRASLRGLPGIEVIVEELSPDVVEAGLRAGDLEEAVKQRVRKVGLPLLGRQDRLKTAPAAALVLRVNTLHDKIGRYFACIELALHQRVQLLREKETLATASTWALPALITVVPDDDVAQIREIVARRADKFAKAYAAANGK
ncbi:hypothetical protein [Nitrospira sp. Kam-Ns4a]